MKFSWWKAAIYDPRVRDMLTPPRKRTVRWERILGEVQRVSHPFRGQKRVGETGKSSKREQDK